MKSFNEDFKRFADRALEEAEELLHYYDSDPHVKPLDDLAKRRNIDSVLADTDKVMSPGQETYTAARYRRVGAIAAAAVLAGVAVWITVSNLQKPPGQESIQVTRAENPADSLTAHILLASGRHIRAGTMLRPGLEVVEGDSIESGNGSMVLGVSDMARVRLSGHSRLNIRKMSGDMIEIHVDEGKILASVEPGNHGLEFVVSTSKGKIVVTGTIFSVHVTDRDVAVDVFRGSVNIERSGKRSRVVTASQSVSMESGTVSSIALEQETGVLKDVRSMELLESFAGAFVDIRSVPSGAAVLLDGEMLGVAPIAASTRAGHRDLEIVMDGYAPVREQLELARGTTASRVFELSAVTKTEEDEEEVYGKSSKRMREADDENPADSRHMLQRAQSLRAGRQWQDAGRAYEQLIRRHPDSPEARTALVSLGMIQLNHTGQPERAIQNFTEYLSKSGQGALVQEAAFNRARAFGKMGRTDREAALLKKFISSHPLSLRVPEARRRLNELEAD